MGYCLCLPCPATGCQHLYLAIRITWGQDPQCLMYVCRFPCNFGSQINLRLEIATAKVTWAPKYKISPCNMARHLFKTNKNKTNKHHLKSHTVCRTVWGGSGGVAYWRRGTPHFEVSEGCHFQCSSASACGLRVSSQLFLPSCLCFALLSGAIVPASMKAWLSGRVKSGQRLLADFLDCWTMEQ